MSLTKNLSPSLHISVFSKTTPATQKISLVKLGGRCTTSPNLGFFLSISASASVGAGTIFFLARRFSLATLARSWH